MDNSLPVEKRSSLVEVFADKSMSDGITTDTTGNIYISDMEHSAVHIIGQDRHLKTLIKDPGFSLAGRLQLRPGWMALTLHAVT